MFAANEWKDYEVLDAGDGEKLERWADIVLRRPDPQSIWPKQNPAQRKSADAEYNRSSGGGGAWDYKRKLPDNWTVSYKNLRFQVHPTGFKHTGLFPEQAANWDWMAAKIKKANRPVKVLNLFGYTGGATMACAAAGAHVTHVDAAKGMVSWAGDNRRLSKIDETKVRWIVDDALKFVEREARRGNHYDGLLMDPPSYGRGPSGEIWKLEDKLWELLQARTKVISENPLFFLVNSYTTGLQSTVIGNMISFSMGSIFGGTVEADELVLPISSGGVLPCGCSGRWER